MPEYMETVLTALAEQELAHLSEYGLNAAFDHYPTVEQRTTPFPFIYGVFNRIQPGGSHSSDPDLMGTMGGPNATDPRYYFFNRLLLIAETRGNDLSDLEVEAWKWGDRYLRAIRADVTLGNTCQEATVTLIRFTFDDLEEEQIYALDIELRILVEGRG